MTTATTGATAGPGHGLGRRALTLGAANAVDYAAQFLLPVVLARCLDAEAFGQYRLLWLAVGTVLAVTTLSVPGSLYYYLPRSGAREKRLYINQTLLYLLAAGLVSAWALSSWNPWLPEKLEGLARHELVVPAFILLWAVASLLDLLPTVEERVAWQTRAIVGLAGLRSIALATAAAVTGELAAVLSLLLAFTVFKAGLLAAYIARYHGLRGPLATRRKFGRQMRFAMPLGVAGLAYNLRNQADQWIAAALFPIAAFAAFSIGTVLAPLIFLFRVSISYVFLPSMSRLEAAGDAAGMLALNSRANVLVGALVFPMLGFAFVFAEELITLVYTAAYLDGAAVMRLYIVGLAALVVDLAGLSMLLKLAGFMTAVNVATLVVAAPLNWYGGLHFGLPGAAIGTVAMLIVDRIVTLRRISRATGVPFARLQDWRTLGLQALFAALAGALAWMVVENTLAAAGPLARVAAGGAVLLAGYAALHASFEPRGASWRELRDAVAGS